MNTALMITRLEFKLFMRNFAGVFFVMAFPILLLLFFGNMFGNQPLDIYGGRGMIDVDVPVFSCAVINIIGILVVPWTVTRYRENKILKRYMATPIKPADILSSQFVVNLVMGAASIAALTLFAKFVYRVDLPVNVLPIALAIFILALCIFSIGLLITSISSSVRASNVISLLVYFPMLFLSGAIMPLDSMPENMARIGKLLPLSYGIDMVKGVWFGNPLTAYGNDILMLLLVSLACAAGSVILFRWE